MKSVLSHLFWDVHREMFTIPFVGIPITWYGLIFAIGFFVGYCIFVSVLEKLTYYSLYVTHADLKKRDLAMDQANALFSSRNFSAPAELIHFINQQVIDQGVADQKISWGSFSAKQQKLLNFFRRIVEPAFYRKIERRMWIGVALDKTLYSVRKKVVMIADSFLVYLVFATVIGARLGHVLFYEPLDTLVSDPWMIFRTWEGGLASHGGILAVFFAVFLFYRRQLKRHFTSFSPLLLLDIIAILTTLEGFFIRVGNFVNQEILGTESTLPWAIVFGSPSNGGASIPRHPAQLYEAFFYLFFSLTIFALWRRFFPRIAAGRAAGVMIFGAFAFRFFIESFKIEQSHYFLRGTHPLLMGQLLSLPVIALGLVLMFLPEIRSFFRRWQEA